MNGTWPVGQSGFQREHIQDHINQCENSVAVVSQGKEAMWK